VGNINAFVNVYKRLNVLTKIAKAADLERLPKIILPGVGHFHAMSELIKSGMRENWTN
jgi:glutamine amidotransferase